LVQGRLCEGPQDGVSPFFSSKITSKPVTDSEYDVKITEAFRPKRQATTTPPADDPRHARLNVHRISNVDFNFVSDRIIGKTNLNTEEARNSSVYRMPQFKSQNSKSLPTEENESIVEGPKPNLSDYRKAGMLSGEANLPNENVRVSSIEDTSKFIDIDVPRDSFHLDPQEMSRFYDDEREREVLNEQ
jgi:hypothetical protein